MKQQSKALRLLFYHLRHTFLVSTQPVAFAKVLVVLHQKELRRTLLSATTVLRLYSVRIFTIHAISCEVRVAVIHGPVLHAAVYTVTLCPQESLVWAGSI